MQIGSKWVSCVGCVSLLISGGCFVDVTVGFSDLISLFI